MTLTGLVFVCFLFNIFQQVLIVWVLVDIMLHSKSRSCIRTHGNLKVWHFAASFRCLIKRSAMAERYQFRVRVCV